MPCTHIHLRSAGDTSQYSDKANSCPPPELPMIRQGSTPPWTSTCCQVGYQVDSLAITNVDLLTTKSIANGVGFQCFGTEGI